MAIRSIEKIATKNQNPGRYTGQWVAFVGGRILTHNPNLKELMKEVKSRKLEKKALVFLVPRKDEGPYVLRI